MNYRCTLCGISVGGRGLEKHYDSKRCTDIADGVRRGFVRGVEQGRKRMTRTITVAMEGDMLDA